MRFLLGLFLCLKIFYIHFYYLRQGNENLCPHRPFLDRCETLDLRRMFAFLSFTSQMEVHSTGELLLSLSYLPAANRLGVVVMKARGLQSERLKDTIGNISPYIV